MTTFRELVAGLGAVGEGVTSDVPVSGITCDSRRVRPGDLFVALKGVHHDGHDHIEAVCRAGAAALLLERPVQAPIPVARVPSTHDALSPVSARFLGTLPGRCGSWG
jgi:UDP-N-acetylmuramyl pentapeptide synthase